MTQDNSNSFKYKVELLGDPVHAGGIARRNVKVVVPLKYLSNFFRLLEMPLLNCNIKLNLTWKKECVLSNQAGVTKTIENEPKKQRGGFLGMLLGTLGASLVGNLLTGVKGMMRAGDGIVRAGDGIVRAGEGSKKKN